MFTLDYRVHAWWQRKADINFIAGKSRLLNDIYKIMGKG